MGSHKTGTVALLPFESLEARLQNTALFPAHKERAGGKRASCAYLKPFVIKVKYDTPLPYRFFLSVNIQVAGSGTGLSILSDLTSYSGVSTKKLRMNYVSPSFSQSANVRNKVIFSVSSRMTLLLGPADLSNA